jgi:hypothetical protein
VKKAPSTDIQAPDNFKHQIPKVAEFWGALVLAIWSFSGAWMLVLGASLRLEYWRLRFRPS